VAAENANTPTVRDAALDTMRRHGLTTIFANPGSTEISFLAGLPDDFQFVLGLHEAAVVGMASGFALGTERPAFVNLHTTAGLGNAVAAIATARVNRAPLVILVGQQDRRHLALEPFLTGRLEGLAGDYPVWVNQPVRGQDVPGAIARGAHEAVTYRGPAVVIVPMDDWLVPYETDMEDAAPLRMVRSSGVHPNDVVELSELIAESKAPALVAGAGAGSPRAWHALVTLAEHLSAPVWQDPFTAQAGFPQDHPQFMGILPAGRKRLRETLAPYDLVFAVGAPIFRQYPYETGPLVNPGTRLALVTDEPDEAHRSPADVALLASPACVCELLVEELPARTATPPPPPPRRRADLAPPAAGEPLRAGHVLSALAERLPRDTILIEETPSSRPELQDRIPAREPLGFLSTAMGILGFAIPAGIGLRMALPERPVVTVVGDGSSLYTIQSLWSAAHYKAGALFVVMSNGRYSVMDRLVEMQGHAGPWPAFDIDISHLARGFGCDAVRIEGHDELLSTLDEVVPTLTSRTEPLLLEAVVAPDTHFEA
jgi:benzoylformate decarboxylase